jgi:pimeloyl-ACP methyl ester carboxylesterase
MAIAAALPAIDPPTDEVSKAYLPIAVQRALAVIEKSALFDKLDSVLISFVKQVHRYLEDSEFRAKVLEELTVAMNGAPRLIIGHSLGSVIAYDWLLHQPAGHRPALLTIGSPLGFGAIRRRLYQPPDRSRWPGDAASWTNIAAGHDPVAMVKELAPLYHPDIDDQPCTNPRSSAHSALSYLRNVRVARAIDKAIS